MFEGAHVVSVYRNEDKQKELEQYVGEAEDMLIGVKADVTRRKMSKRLCKPQYKPEVVLIFF